MKLTTVILYIFGIFIIVFILVMVLYGADRLPEIIPITYYSCDDIKFAWNNDKLLIRRPEIGGVTEYYNKQFIYEYYIMNCKN